MAVKAARPRSGGWLARLAAAAPVPLFAAVGGGALRRVEELAGDPRIERVATSRHAALLLVTGEIADRWAEALARVHDQVPHPRATLLWRARAPVPPGARTVTVADGDDPAAAAVRLFRALLAGERESDDAWLPDEPTHPWRGRGEHGQGGDGMMGGVPYGRPMAKTADDLRDGLALDRVAFTIGPFFPPFPPGLVLDLALQGDVVKEVEVVAPPFPQPPAAGGAAGRSALSLVDLPGRLRGLEWGEAVAVIGGLAVPASGDGSREGAA